MHLDGVLREEHRATVVILCCVGKEGDMWSLFSPGLDLDAAGRRELVLEFLEGSRKAVLPD
jgi:hypothetical protein